MINKIKKIGNKALYLVIILFLISLVNAVPNTLNIQGRLTNPSGNALQGTYNFSFAIYDNYTSGNELLRQNVTLTTDSNGVYNVLLSGINTSFPSQYYLGITVGTDSEASPRINLSATPYTFRANISESLQENNTYKILSLNATGNVYLNNTLNVINGNVGIGTTNPAYLLSVADTTGAGLSLNVSDVLYVNGSSGNVGIGTAGPVSGFRQTIQGDAGTHAMTRYIATVDGKLSGIYIERLGGASYDYDWWLGLRENKKNFIIFDNIAGAERFVIDTSGNVGIGTTSPGKELHVIGSINVSGTDNLLSLGAGNITGTLVDAQIANDITIQTTSEATFGGGYGSTGCTIETDGDIKCNKDLVLDGDFYLGGDQYIVEGQQINGSQLPFTDNLFDLGNSSHRWQDLYIVDGYISNTLNISCGLNVSGGAYIGGDVGIGTTSPSEKLSVMGNVSLNNTLYVLESGDVYFANTSGGNTGLYYNRSSGFVGIGTTNPVNSSHGVNLGVYDVIDDPIIRVWSDNNNLDPHLQLLEAPSNMLEGIDIWYDNNVGNSYFDSRYSGGNIYIRTKVATASPVNAMTILSGGNVGIGTTTPTSALHVNGMITAESNGASTPAINITGTNRSIYFNQSGNFHITYNGSDIIISG